jgi:outer membrane protein TolC
VIEFVARDRYHNWRNPFLASASLFSHFFSRLIHRYRRGAMWLEGEPMATMRFSGIVYCCVSLCALAVPLAAQTLSQPQLLPDSDAIVERLPDTTNYVSRDRAPSTYDLTLADAKARVLENSVIMELASTQIAAKCYTMQAAEKDYLPKLLNAFSYFHFDSDLGRVLTTPGVFNPATTIAVPIINQDAPQFTAMAVQPITPLWKVRQAVNITAADVGAAKAQKREARRQLTKGVEQLYFGMLATQQIKGALEQAVAGARQAAEASNSPDAQISLIQAQQGLLAVNGQLADLSVQMNQLVALPPETTLHLDPPATPTKPYSNLDEAVSAAVASDPKIEEARRQVDKAEAAVHLYEADYMPQVLAYGMYTDQSTSPLIQHDFTALGVSASYTLEWGKKTDTYRAGVSTLCLARQALRKQIQDTSLAAAKAYNATEQAEQALAYAQKLAVLNQQVPLPQNDMTALKAALQARLESGVAAIKAELDYRNGMVELRSISGQEQ